MGGARVGLKRYLSWCAGPHPPQENAMSEPTLEKLASRIARLEQRLRSVALVLLAVVVFAALEFLFWQLGVHKSVEAERFVLHGSDGKIRAMLSTSSDGTPGLVMFDAGDKIRAMLNLQADGAAGLSMVDADGAQRVLLAVLPNNVPSLGIYDTGKKLRAMLSTDPSGTPALTLFDAEQHVLAKFDH
jgi:hypothetical protein